MENILVLFPTEEDGKPGKAAYEAVQAGKSLAEATGAQFSIGIIGSAAQQAANAVASCGAARFYGVSGAEFDQSRYSTDAAAAEALCRAAGVSVVIAPATGRVSRFISGVAYRLGGAADTHITALSGEGGMVTATRWYYRQRMMGNIQRTSRPWVLSTDPGAFTKWEGAAGTAVLEPVQVEVPETLKRTAATGMQAPATSQQTIRPDADLLFVAGAGWTKKQKDGQMHPAEAEKLILGLLEKAQASLGGSKSVVDQKGEGQAVLNFMTHLNQIGQTGATPRHRKGLATCCHGEEPHVVGWRFITERRAVNLDPNCGWAHGKADVLYVADAFEVMEKVNELLAK